MGTTKVIQELVSPIEKLIEAVSGAIGKTYEPHYIRKIADAKAYELKTISDVVRNNCDVPIVYDSTGVYIDTTNFEEISKRAGRRLAYQEITKQRNIESIINNAFHELQETAPIPDSQIDLDWMFRFFNAVENIGNEDIQKIWGRILAGEIRTPSKYSYRTLEKMRNITQDEAKLFQKIAALGMYNCKDTLFILDEEPLINEHGIHFADIITLEECGLISSQNLVLTLSISNKQKQFIWNSQIIGEIIGLTNEITPLPLSVYLFTTSGLQLIDAIQPIQNERYIIDCLTFIRNKYQGKINLSAHLINCINTDLSISYQDADILKSRSQ